ncbi:hypothetical protein B0H14DRAFT_2616360 [Mycena olivaceomarginata]|nr:hypothetical protein B0H14DRAFT_2616360 [Mycena olivaceomarginata]
MPLLSSRPSCPPPLFPNLLPLPSQRRIPATIVRYSQSIKVAKPPEWPRPRLDVQLKTRGFMLTLKTQCFMPSLMSRLKNSNPQIPRSFMLEGAPSSHNPQVNSVGSCQDLGSTTPSEGCLSVADLSALDFDDCAGLQWYAYHYNYFPLSVMHIFYVYVYHMMQHVTKESGMRNTDTESKIQRELGGRKAEGRKGRGWMYYVKAIVSGTSPYSSRPHLEGWTPTSSGGLGQVLEWRGRGESDVVTVASRGEEGGGMTRSTDPTS